MFAKSNIKTTRHIQKSLAFIPMHTDPSLACFVLFSSDFVLVWVSPSNIRFSLICLWVPILTWPSLPHKVVSSTEQQGLPLKGNFYTVVSTCTKGKEYRLSNAHLLPCITEHIVLGTNSVLGKRFSKGVCFHSFCLRDNSNDKYIKMKQNKNTKQKEEHFIKRTRTGSHTRPAPGSPLWSPSWLGQSFLSPIPWTLCRRLLLTTMWHYGCLYF